MNVLQGIILGLVQGLGEFLPISSSGHLVLFQKMFGLEEGVLTFDIAVHLATLIGVFYVLWDDIIGIFKKPLGKLPLLIIAGTIPTALIGFAFNDLFKRLFVTGASLGIDFILTGLALWYAETVKSKNKKINETTYTDAALVGVAQGVAILPGISRSGFTLAGSLIRGLNREFAIKFSFLMSIPAILGAAAKDGYDLLKAGGTLGAGIELWPLLAGMVTAAISGYIAVKFMLRKISKVNLKIFSWYVFAIGIFVLIDQLFFGKFFEKLIF
ncbi:MAG: undecaprenyl-diphosphate phosphatase [Firmicutes bacterium]|nr:undecaprenyl-diphosphate phosphatase [Bacillota bacterium]